MPRGKRTNSAVAEAGANAAEPRRRSSRLAATAATSPEKAVAEAAAEPSPKKTRGSPAKRVSQAGKKGSRSEEKDTIVGGESEEVIEMDQQDGNVDNKAGEKMTDEKHETISGDQEKPEEEHHDKQQKSDAVATNSEEETRNTDKAEHEKNDDNVKEKKAETALAEKKLPGVETVEAKQLANAEENNKKEEEEEKMTTEANDKAANGSGEANSCEEKAHQKAEPTAASPTKAATAVCVAKDNEDQGNHGGVNGNGVRHSNGEEKAAAPAPAATEAAC